MHRYREVHMKRSKRESFCGCVCYLRGKWGWRRRKMKENISYSYIIYFVNRLDAPGICGTRDGGRGGGRQEEGTSGAALCIGGMETEEDEGLTTKGCFAPKRGKILEVFIFLIGKRMLGNEVEEMEDVWRRGVDVVFGEMERRRNRYSDKG